MAQKEGKLSGVGGVEIFWQAWMPDREPRAAIVLSHGVSEHSGRYAHVGEALVAAGYALYSADHRGHGRSAGDRSQIERMGHVVADLRTMVEELWLAGAEAIAINGERVVPTTSIIDIGGVILANSAYLTPPYQISAIGSEDLYEQVVSSPGFADFVRARQDAYGIRIGYLEPPEVDIPAFAGTATLRNARPAPSEAPPAAPASPGTGG